MSNFKKEFLEHVKDLEPKIKCVVFEYQKRYFKDRHGYNEKIKLNLFPNYSQEDYEYFLETLNFNYDSGYGTQEIFGFIWFVSGTFSERNEYDGSEWFEYVKTPEIPVDVILKGEANLLKKKIEVSPDKTNKKGFNFKGSLGDPFFINFKKMIYYFDMI